MTASPQDVQAAFCAVLCDEWARAGVSDAVVSPGSRSTPMTAALDAESRIRTHVVLDERSAGFTALGIGLATHRPAVVVTTSGTASVELHPSVVEAAQAGVPLIAVTTDRPPELHGVGAPQTVEQVGLFAAVARWSADPGVPTEQTAQGWRSLAARAVAEALAGAGPVHLNLAFREPLVGDAGSFEAPPGRPGGLPWHHPVKGKRAHAGFALPSAPVAGVIVAGEGAALDDAEGGAVLDQAARLGWPVLADPRSGCRLPHPNVVAAADALLRTELASDLRPQFVVRLGTPWASKVLGQWLAGLPSDVPQVLVDERSRWADPDRSAWLHVPSDAVTVLEALNPPDRDDSWLSRWQDGEVAAQACLSHLLSAQGDMSFSEPGVARAALAAVPEGGILVASSSMPVRDVEWFGAPRGRIRVLSNRGANGIDGVVSTALGAALGSSAPVICLVGDLAFLYDAGALLWAAARRVALSILVVDNRGGGIFSFLSQADAYTSETFERYWGTPHDTDLAALASSYNVDASRLANREELEGWLAGCSEQRVRVGIVTSERAANVSAHDRLNAAVADAVG